MRYRVIFSVAICVACQLFPAFSQTTFSSFEDFMVFATEKSISLKSDEIALSEARKQKLSAILGILDPTGGGRLSYVNNTRLPVTLVPSELVGGQSGSFENVQFGLQYETQFAAEIDIKLLNLAGWSGMSLANIRIDLEETNKQLSRKELFDHAATLYYQILSLQAQEVSAQTNLEKADSIRQSVILRFEKGLASQQEVNEAEVNYLRLAQSETDISYLTDLQYQALNILCDISEKEEIQILAGERSMGELKEVDVLSNELQIKQAFLNEQYARIHLRKTKLEFAPTLS
ncbi:MAG: TolC family protein, partial [Bacteroidota bacterium]